MTERENEAQLALPHQLGCFEWALEEMIEEAAAEGIVLAGEAEETWHGMSNVNRYHLDLIEGTRECHCDLPSEEE